MSGPILKYGNSLCGTISWVNIYSLTPKEMLEKVCQLFLVLLDVKNIIQESDFHRVVESKIAIAPLLFTLE